MISVTEDPARARLVSALTAMRPERIAGGGYVGIGARLVPNRVHARLVRTLIPVARADDVFRTAYRLNTPTDIRRWFSAERWRHCSYLTNTTPRYFGSSRWLFRVTELYQRVVPYSMRTDLFVFIQRR